MSIIIHGMDMPTSPILFCIHPDGKVFADLEGGWREYKAIPVPPHGPLIDAAALISKATDVIVFNYKGEAIEDGYSENMILKEPVIIEAEEEKENELA